MSTSHVSGDLLAGWVDGRLPDVAAWSVEAHVEGCQPCRAELDDLSVPVTDAHLDGVFEWVRGRVAAPPQSLAERVLCRVGVPDQTARLLVATRSLTWPWLLGVALVAGATLVWAPQLGGPIGSPVGGPRGWSGAGLFLAVTPLVPLVGVGAAFGARTDPAHDLVRAAPYPAGRLLLVRSLAVVMTSVPVMVLAAWVSPAVGAPAAASILPSLAVLAAALALTTWWSALRSVLAAALTWATVLVLVVATAGEPAAALVTVVAQLACAAVAAGGVAVLVSRLPRVDVVA